MDNQLAKLILQLNKESQYRYQQEGNQVTMYDTYGGIILTIDRNGVVFDRARIIYLSPYEQTLIAQIAGWYERKSEKRARKVTK